MPSETTRGSARPDAGTPTRTLVLLAGASGSGKSHLARLSGLPVLRLDDFYLDEDHPGLPRTLGIVDWDDARTWDADGACRAIDELLRTGRTSTPDYSIPQSRRLGWHQLDLGTAGAVVGEGIFAVEAARACAEHGIEVQRWWLDRPRTVTFWRRLRRDLRQHRKAPSVLLRRGLVLWRAEPGLRRTALDAGFEPVTARRMRARMATLRTLRVDG